MDQRGGLECLAGSFVRHLRGREPAQFVVNKGSNWSAAAWIALLGAFEDAGHVAAWFGLRFGCVITHTDRSVLLESLESASFKTRITAQSARSYKEVGVRSKNSSCGTASDWGGGLCRCAVVEIEQAAQTRRLDNLPVARLGPSAGEGDDVVQALMVSFVMMVVEVFSENAAQ